MRVFVTGATGALGGTWFPGLSRPAITSPPPRAHQARRRRCARRARTRRLSTGLTARRCSRRYAAPPLR